MPLTVDASLSWLGKIIAFINKTAVWGGIWFAHKTFTTWFPPLDTDYLGWALSLDLWALDPLGHGDLGTWGFIDFHSYDPTTKTWGWRSAKEYHHPATGHLEWIWDGSGNQIYGELGPAHVLGPTDAIRLHIQCENWYYGTLFVATNITLSVVEIPEHPIKKKPVLGGDETRIPPGGKRGDVIIKNPDPGSDEWPDPDSNRDWPGPTPNGDGWEWPRTPTPPGGGNKPNPGTPGPPPPSPQPENPSPPPPGNTPPPEPPTKPDGGTESDPDGDNNKPKSLPPGGSIPGSLPPQGALTEQVVLYKDYDIAYADQNLFIEPTVLMGSSRVLEAGEDVTLSAALSWSYNSKIVSYRWYIADGVLVSGSLTSPIITCRFNTSGQRTIHCTVTNELGKWSTGHRNIYVYDEDNRPLSDFVLTELSADINEGWRASVEIINPENPEQYEGGAEVVIFGERLIEGKKTSLSFESGTYNLQFRGWIVGGSIVLSPDHSLLSFEAAGPLPVMENQHNFALAVDDVYSAIEWNEVPLLNTTKALYHLLRWHSTILDITDVHIPHNSVLELPLGGQEFQEGNIVEQAKSLVDDQFALMSGSKDGSIWITIDPRYYPYDNTISCVNQWLPNSLTSADLIEEVEWEKNKLYKTNQVEVSGLSYDGYNATAYIVSAPGPAPLYGGTSEIFEGRVLASASQAKAIAAQILTFLNREEEEVNLTLRNSDFLDITPPRPLSITASAAGLNWVNKLGIIQSIDRTFDPETGALTDDISLVPIESSRFPVGEVETSAVDALGQAVGYIPVTGGSGLPSAIVVFEEEEIDYKELVLSRSNRHILMVWKSSAEGQGIPAYILLPTEEGPVTGVEPITFDIDAMLIQHSWRYIWIRDTLGENTKFGPGLDGAVISSAPGRTWDLELAESYDWAFSSPTFSLLRPKAGVQLPWIISINGCSIAGFDFLAQQPKPSKIILEKTPYWTDTNTLETLYSENVAILNEKNWTVGHKRSIATFVPFKEDDGEWGVLEVGITITQDSYGGIAFNTYQQVLFSERQDQLDGAIFPLPLRLVDQYNTTVDYGQIMITTKITPKGGQLTSMALRSDSHWTAFRVNTWCQVPKGELSNWPNGVPYPVHSTCLSQIQQQAQIYSAHQALIYGTSKIIMPFVVLTNPYKSEVKFEFDSIALPQSITSLSDKHKYIARLRYGADLRLVLLNVTDFDSPVVRILPTVLDRETSSRIKIKEVLDGPMINGFYGKITALSAFPWSFGIILV